MHTVIVHIPVWSSAAVSPLDGVLKRSREGGRAHTDTKKDC